MDVFNNSTILSILLTMLPQFILARNIEMHNINILPIDESHLPSVKKIILEAAFELQFVHCTSIEALTEFFNETSEFNDIENFSKVYKKNPKGIFLGMFYKDTLIGMGAIKQISEDTAELKRMFFAKEYRNKGLGTLITKVLIEKATAFGYKKLVLEMYNPNTSVYALSLYKKFGFYETGKGSSGHIFMEKIL